MFKSLQETKWLRKALKELTERLGYSYFVYSDGEIDISKYSFDSDENKQPITRKEYLKDYREIEKDYGELWDRMHKLEKYLKIKWYTNDGAYRKIKKSNK